MATSEQMHQFYAEHPDHRKKISASMHFYHKTAAIKKLDENKPMCLKAIGDYRCKCGVRCANRDSYYDHTRFCDGKKIAASMHLYHQKVAMIGDGGKSICFITHEKLRCKHCGVLCSDKNSFLDHVLFCNGKKIHSPAPAPRPLISIPTMPEMPAQIPAIKELKITQEERAQLRAERLKQKEERKRKLAEKREQHNKELEERLALRDQKRIDLQVRIVRKGKHTTPREQARVRQAVFRIRHRTAVNAKQRQFREDHPEMCRGWDQQYRERNPEKSKLKTALYRSTHKKELREKQLRRWNDLREECNAQKRQYKREHKEAINARRRELYHARKNIVFLIPVNIQPCTAVQTIRMEA
jgi:hypothetical protein